LLHPLALPKPLLATSLPFRPMLPPLLHRLLLVLLSLPKILVGLVHRDRIWPLLPVRRRVSLCRSAAAQRKTAPGMSDA
jgi:hypothetical protein